MSSVPVLTDCELESAERIAHGFFTRRGGVSSGLFASLNAGFGSSDGADEVAQNRALAARALGFAGESLATAYQVHSAEALAIEAPFAPRQAPRADALVTSVPGVLLGVLAADCAPVLFADARAGVVGAAHAGWRGALDGVLEATIEAMERLGASRENIRCAVGPCIGAASYEVGPEFPAPFLESDAAAATFFEPAPRQGHFLFDLAGFVLARLARAGITNAGALGIDTCAEDADFFSYRRSVLAGEADYGRNLSAIGLRDD